MRLYEILNEKDKQIVFRLKKYYKMREGRTGIGWNSHYKILKKYDISQLSERFLDSDIENYIIDNLLTFTIGDPIIAVDIISDFGEHRQELRITIRDMLDSDLDKHDRSQPESDRLVFDSIEDAVSFVLGLKMQFEGNTIEDYKFIIYNELEDKNEII